MYVYSFRATLWKRTAIPSDTSTGGCKTIPGRSTHFMHEGVCFVLGHQKFLGFSSQMPFAVPIPQHFLEMHHYLHIQGKVLWHCCSPQKIVIQILPGLGQISPFCGPYGTADAWWCQHACVSPLCTEAKCLYLFYLLVSIRPSTGPITAWPELNSSKS